MSFSQCPQKVKMLIHFRDQGEGVDDPGEVIRDVNTQEPIKRLLGFLSSAGVDRDVGVSLLGPPVDHKELIGLLVFKDGKLGDLSGKVNSV